MMNCWDVSYPEVARELAVAGAEIIFMPIWGGNETLCRARAIENQVPLVISGYDIRSAIYDARGEPAALAPNWRKRIWLPVCRLVEVNLSVRRVEMRALSTQRKRRTPQPFLAAAFEVIGVKGFEPSTSWSRTKRSKPS